VTENTPHGGCMYWICGNHRQIFSREKSNLPI
jgi:hypothetical protein